MNRHARRAAIASERHRPAEQRRRKAIEHFEDCKKIRLASIAKKQEATHQRALARKKLQHGK